MKNVLRLSPDPAQLCPTLKGALTHAEQVYARDRESHPGWGAVPLLSFEGLDAPGVERYLSDLAADDRFLLPHGLVQNLPQHLLRGVAPQRSLCPCLAPSLGNLLTRWQGTAHALGVFERRRRGEVCIHEGSGKELGSALARVYNYLDLTMEFSDESLQKGGDDALLTVSFPAATRVFRVRRYRAPSPLKSVLYAFPRPFRWEAYAQLPSSVKEILGALAARCTDEELQLALGDVLGRTSRAQLDELAQLAPVAPERLDLAATLVPSFHGDVATLLRLTHALQSE